MTFPAGANKPDGANAYYFQHCTRLLVDSRGQKRARMPANAHECPRMPTKKWGECPVNARPLQAHVLCESGGYALVQCDR